MKNREEKLSAFKERCYDLFSKDDTIKEVLSFDYEEQSINIINIHISLLFVGENTASSFVFPFET